jgi:LmbE family N-acetylglucosaminyl deacetylase
MSHLPAWPTVLVVIAHPDDESFGLGAIIHEMTRAGATVHVLCLTHGEASTLNETGANLHAARCEELAAAGSELGVSSVDLLDYPDGQLDTVPASELAKRVMTAIRQHMPDGLLVFDETGVTGHPDHRAATAAALEAALEAALPRGLPVLAWTLPDHVASQLSHETGQCFKGQPPHRIDVRIHVTRQAQHRASLAHASQISPSAILWRRLHLLGDYEHLRWLQGHSGKVPG